MKFAIVFAGLLAVSAAQFAGFGTSRQPIRPAVAAPRLPAPVTVNRAASDQTASVLRYDNDALPDGSFNYAVEIDNGIAAQAQGVPRDFGGNPPIVPVVSQGAFSWTSPEGVPVAISYIADENGYQPSGDALPTPPPTPVDILKALEYLAKVQKK